MNDDHRKLINDNLSKLCENCNFENVMTYLKAKQVFTGRQLEKYESDEFKNRAEESRNRELFLDIQTRGPHAFEILLKCLYDLGQKAEHRILSRPSHFANKDNLSITVKKSTSFASGQVYKMTSFPRGRYIFINNIVFPLCEKRNGAENDRVFHRVLDEMGFQGEYFENKSTEEMRLLLQNFSERDELAHVDSCFVAISSHGDVTAAGELMIHGSDVEESLNPLLTKEIISLFNSPQCKLREGQPKVFFLQACRGDGWINRGGQVFDRSTVNQFHNPSWKDTFCVAPVIEGLLSNRDEFGSWLFQAARNVFMNHAHNKDLVELTDLIDKEFQLYMEESNSQQTCSLYKYGVHKNLFFNPGLYESERRQP